MKLINTLLFILILLTATVLRFNNLFEIPYTHDEFSALFRTGFDTFHELIEKGVIVDTLPAGVQVFLFYWIKLFGDAEWVVKLPFILFGIFSVYLIYLIARKWYNESVALISASYLASVQFAVIYSQIARPYISGLFFSLLMVYALTNIIKTPERRFYLNSIVFILAASICSYNHHFSLVFAAITGISGLFLIQRKYLLKYLCCCLIIMLLYVPHIGIILSQLKMGGNENWLGKLPDDFFVKYIEYIFQFSSVVYILTVLLVLFGFIKIKKQDIQIRQLILFACWFILPYVIGFLYSKYVNNVMQYSVLIFSFPFLYFILFGHIKQQKAIINALLVVIILSVNIYALVSERKHYVLFYKSIYESVLTDYQDAKKNYNNIASLVDSDRDISKYYIQKHKIDTGFVWFDSFADHRKEFVTFLQNQSQSSEYLYFGCLSSNNPVTVSVIQDYYPTIELQKNYFGGTTYIFSKAPCKESRIIDCLDFESKESKGWSSVDTSKFVDTVSFSGKYSYVIDSNSEWSFTYTSPLIKIIRNKNNFIDISVRGLLPVDLRDALLVASIGEGDSVIYWGASSFSDFSENKTTKNDWVNIHHSIKLSDIPVNNKDALLKIYIWNKGKNRLLIDDFTIRLRYGNPLIYSQFQKI